MSLLQSAFRRIVPVSGDAGTAVRRQNVAWRPWTVVGSVQALLLLLACIGPAAATSGTTEDAPAASTQTASNQTGDTRSADAPVIAVDLNRLEDVEGGCRLSLLFTNSTPSAIESMSIEAVLFDTQDRVERFLLLKTRPLATGRTRVQQFDVKDAACASIGRVLLNDVTQCDGEGLDPAGCLAVIETSSRSGVPFVSTVATD